MNLREVIEHASQRVRAAQSPSMAGEPRISALAYAEGVLDVLATLQPEPLIEPEPDPADWVPPAPGVGGRPA